jgi:hypothetical protein
MMAEEGAPEMAQEGAPEMAQKSRRRSSAFGVLPSLNDEFVGWHPSPKDQAALDCVLPGPKRKVQAQLFDSEVDMGFSPTDSSTRRSAHTAATACERGRRLLPMLPMHCARTMLTCVVPVAAGMLPVLLDGAHSQRMVSDLPHISAVYADFEKLNEVRSTGSSVLQAVKSVQGNSIFCMLFLSTLLALLAPKVVWPPVFKWLLPLYGCVVALRQLNVFAASAMGITFLGNTVAGSGWCLQLWHLLLQCEPSANAYSIDG